MANLYPHHKFPLHAGGSEDPSNIEYLTIEQHAEAHRILYEKYGRLQDRVEWLELSRLVPAKDVVYVSEKQNDFAWMFDPTTKKSYKKPEAEVEQLLLRGWRRGRK